MLYRINMFLNIQKRKLLFNSYILTHLDYCCIIWGNYSASSEYKLIISKGVARVILNKTLETQSAESQWMTFPERVRFPKALQAYK